MTSWTNVFSGKAIRSTDKQYESLALAADTTLVWPLESASGVPYVAAVIDIRASVSCSLTMPPATGSATGVISVMQNKGSIGVSVKDNTGVEILFLDASLSWLLILTDNSTVAGVWETIQIGATSSDNQAAALAGGGLQAILDRLQSYIVTTRLSANTTLTTTHRASAEIWTGAAGTFQLDAKATLTNGWWTIVSNDGSGNLTLSTTGPDTIDGVASLVLPPSGTDQPYSLLVVCASDGFHTFFGTPIPTPIAAGGTGATTALGALQNFGGTTTGIALFTSPSIAAVLALLGISPNILLEQTIAVDKVVSQTDSGAVYVCTATLDLTVPQAATVTNAFFIGGYAIGGNVTITPDPADSINGGAAGDTLVVQEGGSFLLVTDGGSPAGKWWTLFLTQPSGNWAVAAGTSDAITATYSPANAALADGLLLGFRALLANTTTTPTFAPDGLPAKVITRNGGGALVPGDIPGPLAECLVRYNLANTRWELLNPAVSQVPWAIAAGTVDAIIATYTPPNTTLADGLLLGFRALGPNASTTPTFAPDGHPPLAMTKSGGAILSHGDIPADLCEVLVRLNLSQNRWELINPANPLGAGGTGSFVTKSGVSYAATVDDSDKTFLFSNTGAGAHTFTLPDPATIVDTWKCHLIVDSSDGDYITLLPGAASNIGGKTQRISGVGTDVDIYFDGTNFQTAGLFQFTSSFAAFVAASGVILTHNFGVSTSKLRAVAKLKNVTPEYGYAAGDTIDLLTFTADNLNGMATFVHSTGGNSSTLLIAAGIGVTNKTTFLDAGFITPANWRAQIVVWAP